LATSYSGLNGTEGAYRLESALAFRLFFAFRGTQGDLLGHLELCTHPSTTVLGMGRTTGLADPFRSDARSYTCVALWPCRPILLYAGNRAWCRLILRKSVGSKVFYQANRSTLIFPEMRALIDKTIGIFGALRSPLRPLSKQIVVAFVYMDRLHENRKQLTAISI
jgi:hypothetical protein